MPIAVLCLVLGAASRDAGARQAGIPAADEVLLRMETSEGAILLAVDSVAAPVTATNFLRYVDAGFYEAGTFFRTVRMDNQPRDSIRIEVIQGGGDTGRRDQFFDPIPLERTSATGLRHLDGSVSMARSGPDTATHSFFICIGDQPELDFGGARNPDGQGFAAFGRVVDGMEVVRRIQAGAAEGQTLTVPVRILRVVRLAR